MLVRLKIFEIYVVALEGIFFWQCPCSNKLLTVTIGGGELGRRV